MDRSIEYRLPDLSLGPCPDAMGKGDGFAFIDAEGLSGGCGLAGTPRVGDVDVQLDLVPIRIGKVQTLGEGALGCVQNRDLGFLKVSLGCAVLVERIADLERYVGETDGIGIRYWCIFSYLEDGEVMVIAK